MADRTFELLFVPKRVADRIPRQAVLSKLYRPIVSGDDDLIWHYTLKLQKAWRLRLIHLAKSGWTPRGYHNESTHAAAIMKAVQYARNCQPTFCACTQISACCRQRYICPFCYGRWVGGVWSSLSRAFPAIRYYKHHPVERDRVLDLGPTLPPTPGRNEFPFILIERRRAYRLPFLPTPECQESARTGISPGLYARRVRKYEDGTLGRIGKKRFPLPAIDLQEAEQYLHAVLRQTTQERGRWIKQLQPTGAFVSTVVQPWPYCWHVEQRQLLMFPTGYIPNRELLEANTTAYREHYFPNRPTLAKAVVRTCAYPQWLMRGSAELTAVLLRARRGTRLSAMYGAFREPKECDDG
jgi:hypothetical protein